VIQIEAAFIGLALSFAAGAIVGGLIIAALMYVLFCKLEEI
jgi:hypothetical protein